MDDDYDSLRHSQVAAIDRTFEEARKPITEHPEKRGVVPVEIMPVFPNFDLWKYPFAHVQFDSEPAPPTRLEAMNRAIIRGILDESGERFVGYFVPTEETLAKRKIDDQEGRQCLDDCEYEYKLEREYDWNVESRFSEGYVNDYFFVFRDDCVVYNELEIRVRLTKRRAETDTAQQTNSKLVVKYRPFEDCELRQGNFRLRSLRPPDLDTSEQEDSDKELSNKSDKESREVKKKGDKASELRQHELKQRSPLPTEEAMVKHKQVPTPFIDLNSLFPANAQASSDPKTHLTDSPIPLNDCTMPTKGSSFDDASSPTNIDCSAVANGSNCSNGSSNPSSSTGVPQKKRKRGQKCKTSNPVTCEQWLNVSTGWNLADAAVLDKSVANQGIQPPLIDYDSTDQNPEAPDETSDSDRPFYATKRIRIRPADHSDNLPGLADSFHFSDSEFEHFYSQENLYNDRKYFDNRRHRIFAQKYGDEVRVFKPVCIVRESGSVLLKVLGLYCLDVGKLRADQRMPPGFIWPLRFGKHDENVATIRRLIKENPVDDRLPYVSMDESAVVQPFSLDAGDEDENMVDRIGQRAEVVDHERVDEEADENDENLDKKHPFRLAKINRNESNSEADAYKGQPKSSKPRAAHCPYCYRLFSASFNAKMHFKGRFKQSGIHISCPVSSKLSSNAITLEPVICAGPNCEECLKRQSNEMP